MALALLGSIAFSGKAIIVKLAYRYGVDAVTLIMYRMLFALPIFAAMAWWASRGKPPLSRKDWLGVLGLGVTGYYLASFLDFAGLMYVTASLERLILYLNPTLVVVLGWALYGKRIRAGQALGMGISYCGVVLVFGLEAREQGAHAAWGALLIFFERRELCGVPGLQRRDGAAHRGAASGGLGHHRGLPVLPGTVRGAAAAGGSHRGA